MTRICAVKGKPKRNEMGAIGPLTVLTWQLGLDLFPSDTSLFCCDALVFSASVSRGESIKAALSLALARHPRCLFLLGTANLYR